MADLGEKVPYLQCLLRPEYAAYFGTAGTVLLGWLVVCWFLNVSEIFILHTERNINFCRQRNSEKSTFG